MRLFDRIKEKAGKAIQSAGNFIDRDKSVGGVQLAKGGLGNSISNAFNQRVNQPINNFFQPSPESVRTRDFVRELPKATYDTVTGIPSGFFGQWDDSKGMLYPDQATWQPQNTPEKVGAGLYEYGVSPWIQGANTGITDATSGGFELFNAIPQVSATKTVLANKLANTGDNLMARASQKLNPVDITLEDMRDVTSTQGGTPYQQQQYARMKDLASKTGSSYKDYLRQPGQGGSPLSFLDDLLNQGKNLFQKTSTSQIPTGLPSGPIDKSRALVPYGQGNYLDDLLSGVSQAPALATQPSASITQPQKTSDYSSADEFIEAQNKVFRGDIIEPFDKSKISPERGVSVTDNRMLARDFAELKKSSGLEPEFISELYIDNNAKILKEDAIPKKLKAETQEALQNFANSGLQDKGLERVLHNKQQAIIDFAKKNGFDGVRMPEASNKMTEQETVILNPDVINTPSQLKNIYNQALATQPSASITQPTDATPMVPQNKREAIQQGLYETIAEMEVAEAGQRLYDEDGSFSGSISSTFPSWVSSDLRRSDLFSSVMSGFSDPTNIVYPPESQPRKRALYDEILSRVASKADIDEGDIINQIKEAHVQQPTETQTVQETRKQPTEVEEIVHSSTPGGEGTEAISPEQAKLEKTYHGGSQTPIGLNESPPQSFVDELLSKSPAGGGAQPPTSQPSQSTLQIDEILEPKSKLEKIIDRQVRPSLRAIERSGPAGEKITDIINRTKEEVDLTIGNQVDPMRQAINTLNNEEKKTLYDAIEGEIEPISDNQAKAIKVWEKIRDDIYQRGQKSDLDVGFIENYAPHHVPLEQDSSGGSFSRGGERKYGSLEMARQNDAPYDKDPSNLIDYIKRANKRLIEVKNYGPADENLYSLATETRDPQQTTQYLDQILGKNQPKDTMEAIRSAQTVRKLNPLTSLQNLAQNLSTALRTDIPTTTKAIFKSIKNPEEAISVAIRAGELDADVGRVFEDYAGSGGVAGKWIRLIGMEGTEKINRIIATNAGVDYFKKLNKQALNGNQAALREIERLGMEVNDGPIKAGRKISREAQLSTERGELPYGWKTSLGKLLTQFKSFAYKHTQFIGKELGRTASEASKGNFKPLVNLLGVWGVLSPIAGEIIGDVRSLAYNKKRDARGLERYLENIFYANSLGLLDPDTLKAATGKYGEGGIIGTFLGPTGSDVYNVAQTIDKIGADNKYDRRKAHRNILRQIPVAGSTLANTLVPNSYVDNYIGPNEGLGEKDKQTFLNIQSTDKEGADLFKQKKQQERKTRNEEKSGWLKNVFGGDDKASVNWTEKPTSKEEKKAYKDAVIESLDTGVTPPKEAISNSLFSGKSATSNKFKDRKEVYKTLNKVLNDEEFPYDKEIEDAVLEAAGASREDYEFYKFSKLDTTSRLQELIPVLGDLSDPENFEKLALLRRRVGGHEVLSNGMINDLYRKDYISKSQKSFLKNLQYDEIDQQFYGKGSGSSSSSSSSRKASYKALKKANDALIPPDFSLDSNDSTVAKINSLLAEMGKLGQKTQSKMLDDILAGPPAPQTQIQGDDLWFTPARG